jgi:nucleotide-binding universal stress UspA family protein
MIRPQTVVAAVDFSAGSAAALVQAAGLAERSGAALHLFHADVLFRSSGDGALPEGAPSSTLRVRIERFAAEALGLADAAALDRLGAVVAVARDVTAPAAILRYADEVGADLLVVGTHGRSGVARLLLGSVAEAIVASAPCPVLTVSREAAGTPGPDAPVLVAVDFTERSRAAVDAGRALADLYGAPLELVHVVHDAGPYPGFAPQIASLLDFDPDRGAAVKERLERFAAGAEPAAVHVALGTPSRLVAAVAANRRAGTLVMGTHGRTGLAHALVGSVAAAALRRAPCPVFTLKQAEPAGPARPVRSALAV